MKTKQTKGKRRVVRLREIKDYDARDTTSFIGSGPPLSLEDLGFALPAQSPTQVVSIRLPTDLLNELRALGSENDVPYQALIKLFLRESVDNRRKKAA